MGSKLGHELDDFHISIIVQVVPSCNFSDALAGRVFGFLKNEHYLLLPFLTLCPSQLPHFQLCMFLLFDSIWSVRFIFGVVCNTNHILGYIPLKKINFLCVCTLGTTSLGSCGGPFCVLYFLLWIFR